MRTGAATIEKIASADIRSRCEAIDSQVAELGRCIVFLAERHFPAAPDGGTTSAPAAGVPSAQVGGGRFGTVLVHLCFSVVIVEAVAGNRLATTARARLQVATNDVQATAWNTAIITLRTLEIIGSPSVCDAIVFLTVDHKSNRSDARLFISVPPRSFVVPGHVSSYAIKAGPPVAQRPPR
jgi:hypothetical protein